MTTATARLEVRRSPDAVTGEAPVIVHFASCTGHGGDALHILRLSAAQRAAGYDARVLIGASEHTALFAERAGALGVPCEVDERLPLRQGQSLGSAAAQLRRLRVFRAALARHRPAVIHLHTGGLALRTVEVVGARLTPAALRVATLHCGYPWAPGSERKQAQWRRTSSLLDCVSTPSRAAAAFQRDAGVPESRVVVLPNAVEVESVARADGAEIRRELGLDAARPLVLFLARLDRAKHPHDVVLAFATIADRVPHATLVVVGDGEMRAECERLAALSGTAGRIRFLGFRRDVPQLMRAADVYVLPTERESFGLTLVEAMAAGAAIVTTDAAPMRGEVIAEEGAEFVPPGDVDALAAAMLRLLTDPERRRALAAAGRARAAAEFSPEAAARRHAAFYDARLRAVGRAPLRPGRLAVGPA